VDVEAYVQQMVLDVLAEQQRDDDGYLNAEDAARFLGLTRAGLYARVGREQVPYWRVGRRVLFDRRELRAWVTGDPTPES